MKRLAVLIYGVTCYAVFFATFLYLAGFLGNVAVPKSMDAGPPTPLAAALAIDAALVAIFALQHSVMARPTFKRWWTRFVPAPIERSTYVMATNLVLILLFWQWRPVDVMVWNVTTPMLRTALHGLFAAGFLTVLVTTCLINHFDLFGLRQVWLYFRGRPYTRLSFATPGPYSVVRHPLYVGWLTAFWATPTMSAVHFVFAAGMTIYILIAILFEERNLLAEFGESYRRYRREVPMLIPRLRPREQTADRGHANSNAA